MKKSFALVLALFMLVAVLFSSCQSMLETTTAAETSGEVKVDEFDFIRKLVDAYAVSETDLNFDVKKILTGKLSEFEFDAEIDGEQINAAYKDGVAYFSQDGMGGYIFLTDDGYLVSVTEDGQEAYVQNLAEMISEEFGYGVDRDVDYFSEQTLSDTAHNPDILTDMLDAIKLIDFEPLLKRDNFVIDGKKYTLKESVLRTEIVKQAKKVMESLGAPQGEATDEELAEMFFGSLKSIEITFEKWGVSKMKSIALAVVDESYGGQTQMSAYVELNTDFLPVLVTSSSTVDFGEGSGGVTSSEMKYVYNDKNALTGASLTQETTSTFLRENQWFVKQDGKDFYGTVAEVSVYKVEAMIDLTALDHADQKVLTVKQSSSTSVSDEYLIPIAEQTGFPIGELRQEFNRKGEEYSIDVTMNSTASGAFVGTSGGGEMFEGEISFETSKLDSVPANVIAKRDSALAEYKASELN